MGRVAGGKSSGTQLPASEGGEFLLEALREAVACLAYPPAVMSFAGSVEPYGHKAALDQAALCPVATGSVHACGTLEDLLEIITWKQLGLYLKPIVVLNINGYFTPLLNMLEKAIEENFMRPEHVKLWEVANTPEEAVDLLYTIPMWNKEFRKFAAI